MYFFSDLVLMESAPLIAGGSLAEMSTANNSTSPDGVARDGDSSVNPKDLQTIHFQGIKGRSGGLVSLFKTNWQRLYTAWPLGKKLFHRGAQPIIGASVMWHERAGIFLTLISLFVGIGVVSLAIDVVEKKARA